jgi:hypothetical protein
MAPSVCPNCGEDVPEKALACPECGADWDTGWKLTGYAGGETSDPEDEFDYREAFDKEFGSSAKPVGMKLAWWIVGVVLLVALFLGSFSSVF